MPALPFHGSSPIFNLLDLPLIVSAKYNLVCSYENNLQYMWLLYNFSLWLLGRFDNHGWTHYMQVLPFHGSSLNIHLVGSSDYMSQPNTMLSASMNIILQDMWLLHNFSLWLLGGFDHEWTDTLCASITIS